MIPPTPAFSRTYRTLLVVGFVCLFVALSNYDSKVSADRSANPPSATPMDASIKTRIAERFGNLPLSFEINKGQIDQPVKFLSHGQGYDLFLTAAGAVLTLRKPHAPAFDKFKRPDDTRPDAEVRESSVLRLTMIGANSTPDVQGEDELPGKVNYFTGNDPTKWRRNIPTYRKVHYTGVYPGIDVVYYGSQRELEYDFVVAAGANPKDIRFSVEGTDQIHLDKTGNLLLALKHGEVRLNKPLIYQLTKEGERHEVKGAYVISGKEIRFKVSAFDSTKPLVIDPVLSYSTFLGAGGNEHAFGIAVDSQGSAYVTGSTDVSRFPTTAGAFQTTSDFGGAFVTKLDPTGSSLVYSTYLTGSGGSTGTSIAVDSAGNAHVTGSTSATDFPIVNGLKTSATFFKTSDAAANWNNINTGLVGEVNTIAVAPNAPNTIYVGASSGIHRSTDAGATWTKTPTAGLPAFPFSTALAVDPTNSSVVYTGMINGGLFKTTDGGNNWTAVNIPQNFVTVFTIVFDPATPATMYVGSGGGLFKSTDSGNTWTPINNFGIPGVPNVRALAIDPTTPATIYAGSIGNGGFFKSTNGGSSWTLMNTGMSNPTSVNAIVLDPGNPSTIYTGHGGSGGINKSTNGGASWTLVNNGLPSFEIKALVATASTIYAATNGGGVVKTINGATSWTNANAGLWSVNIRALVGHPTNSAILYSGASASSFPDAFITKLNSSGSGLLFSTYLGGSLSEFGNGIAVDSSGNISVVGETNSANFPAVNAHQSPPTAPDCRNAFVTRINPAVPSYVFSTYLGGSQCDLALGVAVDPAANVYVTGLTGSTDFPTLNALQAAKGDPFTSDAFVAKFTSNGSLTYSTYLGGNQGETGHGIAADLSGNAYVTGVTTSTNFPTVNPIQATNGGFDGDTFVAKLNSQGSALVYSTYLGGSSTDVGRGIAVDSTGNAYVTGFTSSQEFPIVAGALRTRSALFKSSDGAAQWTNDNYGLRAPSISSIAVHPTQPTTIYAGTGVGVFKSTNGGKDWSAINNGLTGLTVIGLIIDPLTPSTVYAAVNDFGGNNNGIYKSTDGGNSWNLRRNGMSNPQLLSFVIDPVTPATLYAGVIGGPVIYKTTDGADNWAPSGSVPPFSFPVSMAIDPHTPATIYAAESSSGGGVFRSINAGATWQPVGLNQTGPHGVFVGVSPHTAGLVYAATNGGGLLKSVDSGDNWSLVRPVGGKVVFDPVSPATLYLFSFSEGVLKSTDSGQTWIPMNQGLPTPSAVALAINPLATSTLYLAASSTNDDDAFVTKINSAGSALVYSTLIGGVRAPNDSLNLNDEAFAIAIDSAGNAYVTGLARGVGFPTTPNSFQPLNRGASDAFISKLTMSYVIGGHVLEGGGTAVSGADVILSDGASITSVVTESDGSYEFSHLREGGSFTVSATKPHFTMAPPSQSFNNLTSNQTLNFTATATNAAFFTINGKVASNGVGLSGVTVTLSGSQPGIRTTDNNGNYSFELAGGGNYTVTPSILGFTFGPASQTFNNLSASQAANFAATRQSFVVTNANNHGNGSLRDAILNANATVGLDTIVFNIPGPGVKVINLVNALPEITDAVVINAATQPGYAGSPLIELDGTQLGDGNGLVIKAGGTTVRGLAIGRFNSFGIWVRDCDNNVIQGNYIGVDATGTLGRGNHYGILLSNSSNNLIGGTTAATRNVISGNSFTGIEIGGIANVIQGNFIGTNAAGTAAIPNGINGVEISSSQFINNLIGGTSPGAGNLISGNQRGISTNAPGTTIQGNAIGTDVTGTNKVPNGTGIDAGAENTLIGGLTPAARNIISGNTGNGVSFGGNGSKLQGNYIGTDITGTLALGNGGNGVSAGVNALIGGTVPEARNVIAANAADGNGFGNVTLGSGNSSDPGATVQGNYIGTDATGTRALGNTFTGIFIFGDNHLIGGLVAGARNVISGNQTGIQIGGSISTQPQGNVIQGNFIGLNALGTSAVPNTLWGIAVVDAINNTIGGTQSGAANTIAFNGDAGVLVSQGTGNLIRRNSIFSNGGLGIDLGAGSFPSGPNGVSHNDVGDADAGPNNLQNFPLLTSVMSVGGNTTIQGSLNSTPGTTFQIDFYSSAALDASGNGEGALFFNTTSVTTDANGNATINATFPAPLGSGRVVTATATDPGGNTSEFSAGDASGAAGNVQFSVSSIQVIEDVGLATITVLRKGGSTGNLTVDYATFAGTATAGQDYTSTSGTLNFSGGETSKSFQIPITDDATTEPDETFTVALRNASSVETLGAPSLMVVTIQDRTTVPFLFLFDTSVVEGNAGTTTEILMTVNLSAATGRTVSVNYATSNFGATGGASCNNQGIDYETRSGTITFEPGTTAFTIPVKICGDTSAEANESFVLVLSSPSNATLALNEGFGTIINDDVLELVLEDSGPAVNQAAALDALLAVRDPFKIVSIPDWFGTGPDRNTRVILFARNLQLNPGESATAVRVRLIASNNQVVEVLAEDVRSLPNSDLTQVVFRLPDNLAAGACTVIIRAHGRFSNTGTIRIAP
jgi:photosystem II stability/assembly factor-like uncharacterized protein